MIRQSKGNTGSIGIVVPVLAVIGVIIALAYFFSSSVSAPGVRDYGDATPVEVVVDQIDTFKELEEPKGTPEEINNDVLDDLDQAILDIEKDLEDDLGDLGL